MRYAGIRGAIKQMSADRPRPGVPVQNFLKVLSLIDRTIIGRRISLRSGKTELVLRVARQFASLEQTGTAADTNSVEHVLAALIPLCRQECPITYHLEPCPEAFGRDEGVSATALVNAQMQESAEGINDPPKQYNFTKDGWPLSVPPDSSYASLEAAARIAFAMSGWEGLHDGKLKPPTLILAISDDFPEDISVSVDGAVTITSTPPSLLGHFVSRWRNHE